MFVTILVRLKYDRNTKKEKKEKKKKKKKKKIAIVKIASCVIGVTLLSHELTTNNCKKR